MFKYLTSFTVSSFKFIVDNQYQLYVDESIFQDFNNVTNDSTSYLSLPSLRTFYDVKDYSKNNLYTGQCLGVMGYYQSMLYIAIDQYISKEKHKPSSDDIDVIIKNIPFDISVLDMANICYEEYDISNILYMELMRRKYPDIDYSNIDIFKAIIDANYKKDEKIKNIYITDKYLYKILHKHLSFCNVELLEDFYHAGVSKLQWEYTLPKYLYYKYPEYLYHKYIEYTRKSSLDDTIIDRKEVNIFIGLMPVKLYNALNNTEKINVFELYKNYKFSYNHYFAIYDKDGNQYIYLNPLTFPYDRQDLYTTAMIAIDEYGDQLTKDDIVYVQSDDDMELVFISSTFIANHSCPLQFAIEDKHEYDEYSEKFNFREKFLTSILSYDQPTPITAYNTKVLLIDAINSKYFKINSDIEISKDLRVSNKNIYNDLISNADHVDKYFPFDIYYILSDIVEKDPSLKFENDYEKGDHRYSNDILGLVSKDKIIEKLKDNTELPEGLYYLLNDKK